MPEVKKIEKKNLFKNKNFLKNKFSLKKKYLHNFLKKTFLQKILQKKIFFFRKSKFF